MCSRACGVHRCAASADAISNSSPLANHYSLTFADTDALPHTAPGPNHPIPDPNSHPTRPMPVRYIWITGAANPWQRPVCLMPPVISYVMQQADAAG